MEQKLSNIMGKPTDRDLRGEWRMGERYWISGVQLGVLVALTEKADRQTIIDEIVDKQFLGDTKDLKKIRRVK